MSNFMTKNFYKQRSDFEKYARTRDEKFSFPSGVIEKTNIPYCEDGAKERLMDVYRPAEKEQRLDDTLNMVASLMEDDVDTHSIAKAVEKADFRVSIDNGSMGSIIMRKDTKKRQVKFEKTDEAE